MKNGLLVKSNVDDNFYRPAYNYVTYGGCRNLLENIAPANLTRQDYFITNLYPFGRTNGNLTEREKSYFGFENHLTYPGIIQVIKEYRFSVLKTFFKSFNWQDKLIFFCIGNGISNIFPDLNFVEFLNNLYSPNLPDFTKTFDNISLKVDNKGIRFILPHASRNQINDEIIEFLSKKLCLSN